MKVPFRQIQFGYASAEVESAEAPRLLLDAFLDPHNLVEESCSGRKFLILGFKGSGKSSVGLHLALVAKSKPTLFVKNIFVADLSYKTLSTIVESDIEAELRYPKAWSWLILLTLMSSLTQDHGAQPSDGRAFEKAVRVLRNEGLLPADNLGELVGRSSLTSLGLSAWGFELSGQAEAGENRVAISVFIHHLKELIATTHTESRHVLVIDGLDDVLLNSDLQLNALSALILEASRLNQFFRERAAPFKILVLCRTDIYERLPGANQNKIRQDLALELEWFEESADPKQAKLVKLANLRARLVDPALRDLFRRYFPHKVSGKDPVTYLLEYTRHTPRDFLQLLGYIQRATTEVDDLVVNYNQVRAGIRGYSEKYFLPEIRDELDGVLSRAETDAFVEILRQFHAAEFTQEELINFLRDSQGPDIDLVERSLKALYNCGAIGNFYIGNDGLRRYCFRHRNPGTVYNKKDTIVVHKGLRRALQL